jgi:hypothetical protein
MDDRERVCTEDFLQAAIDDVQGRKDECEPLLIRIQKMRKQTKEIDDSTVQSIKDGRITPEMASRWIRSGL